MLRRWGDKLKALGGKKKKKRRGLPQLAEIEQHIFYKLRAMKKTGEGKKREKRETLGFGSRKAGRAEEKKKNVNTEEKRCLSASRPFFLERKISSSLSFFLCLLGCSAFLSASYVFACRPVSPPACLPACFPGRASLPSALSCAAVHTLSLLCSPVKWVPHGPAGCSQSLHGWQRRAADRQPKIKEIHTRKSHSHSQKVQRSLPADLENATVLKVASRSVKTPPPPPLMSICLAAVC